MASWLGDESYDETGEWDWKSFIAIVGVFLVLVAIGLLTGLLNIVPYLGTILGLIQSFEAIGSANAQQRSQVLAQGISTAMNATMLGLAVAIPSMIAFSFLMNKTNKLTAQVDQTAVKVLDIIKQRYYDAEMQASGVSHTHTKKTG